MKSLLLISLALVGTLLLVAGGSVEGASELTTKFVAVLQSTTELDYQISIWNDPQAALFTYMSRGFLCVTTADGKLNCMDSSTGAPLWSKSFAGTVKENTLRSSRGNKNGLFIFQANAIIKVDPLSGAELFKKTVTGLQPGAVFQLYEDILLLNDESSIVALSTSTGLQRYAFHNRVSNSQIRTDPSGSGAVAFVTTGVTSQVVLVNKNGVSIVKYNIPSFQMQSIYLNSCTSDSVYFLIIDGGLSKIQRYPKWQTDITASPTGYSFSCEVTASNPGGSANYCNGAGYTHLYVNTKTGHEGPLHLYNVTTGKLLKTSTPHPPGHLVALSNAVSLSSSSGDTVQVKLFDSNSLELKKVWQLPQCQGQAYNIRQNWANAMMMPKKDGGFYVLFAHEGAYGTLIDMPPPNVGEAIVENNIIVAGNMLYFTSGKKVLGYSF